MIEQELIIELREWADNTKSEAPFNAAADLLEAQQATIAALDADRDEARASLASMTASKNGWEREAIRIGMSFSEARALLAKAEACLLGPRGAAEVDFFKTRSAQPSPEPDVRRAFAPHPQHLNEDDAP